MTGGRSTLLAATALLGSLLTVGLATTAVAQNDLGEMVWPSEAHRPFVDLAELGAEQFAEGSSPSTVGVEPVESFRAERISEDRTRLLIEESGASNHSWTVDHAPADMGKSTDLRVQPGDVPEIIAVYPDRDPREQDVLHVYGPPGSFGLEGETVEEKLASLTGALEFPIERTNTGMPSNHFPGLFGHQRACIEESEDSCRQSVGVDFDCPSCEAAVFVAPEGGSPFDRDLRGVGITLFDGEGRLVAAMVGYHLDVDESILLERSDAIRTARDALQDRGYGVTSAPAPNDVRLALDLSPDRVEPERLLFRWSFGVTSPDSDRPMTAEVLQDGITGSVTSVDLSPQEEAQPSDGFLEEVPALGPTGTVAVGLLIAAGRSGRYRS